VCPFFAGSMGVGMNFHKCFENGSLFLGAFLANKPLFFILK
jgi:hypothetical protein